VAITGDGSLVGVGSARGLDKKVYLFSGDGDLLWTYQAGGWVNGIDFSGDGKYLAAVTDDGVVSYFSTETAPPTPAVPTVTMTSTQTGTVASPTGMETVPVSPPAGTTALTVATTTALPVQTEATKAGCAPFTTAVLGVLFAGFFLSVKGQGR